jgi:hypothetical protein
MVNCLYLYVTKTHYNENTNLHFRISRTSIPGVAVHRVYLLVYQKPEEIMWITYDEAVLFLNRHGIRERKLEKAIIKGTVKFMVSGKILYVKQSTLKNLLNES